MDTEDESDWATLLTVGVGHVIGIAVVIRGVQKFCCRRASTPNGAQSPGTAEVEHLQPQKLLSTSYLLWLGTGFVVNAHLFYLERIIHGLLATWTMNFLGIGWIIDGLLIPYYVSNFNTSRTTNTAPPDATRRRLLFHLPLLVFSATALLVATAVYLPSILHSVGVVDIDRLAAQTEVNPYDVLGIPYSAGLQEARSAYRKESLRWHPDRNHGCGKECEKKMSEITKAFELIKKRRAPAPEEKTWAKWLEGIGTDWEHVFQVLTAQTDGTGTSTTGSSKQERTDL